MIHGRSRQKFIIQFEELIARGDKWLLRFDAFFQPFFKEQLGIHSKTGWEQRQKINGNEKQPFREKSDILCRVVLRASAQHKNW